MTEQTGQYVGIQAPEGPINLGLGQPSPALLPMATLARAAARLEGADPLLLQYGNLPGFIDFRESLARFLSEAHGAPIDAGSLMLSGGISQSLSLIADVFARRHGVVVVEDPTYFLTPGIFASAGVRMEAVPVDAEGLRVDVLRQRLDAGLAVDVVYTIPSFHNPTGVVLSDARREALIALAEERDFIVVADEPYNLLHLEGEAPLPLACLDAGRDRVLSVSSFTKLLAPGLRLGWVHGSAALLARLMRHGTLVSGGALNPVMAYVVQGVIDSGELGAHIARLRGALRARRDALCDALLAELPEARFDRPQGGYFVWAQLPEGVSTSALLADAREQGVAFTPGSRCGVDPALDRNLRLSVAFYDEGELREGVRRLAAVVRR